MKEGGFTIYYHGYSVILIQEGLPEAHENKVIVHKFGHYDYGNYKDSDQANVAMFK